MDSASSQPKRIVVLISNAGTNLVSLVESIRSGKINGDIVAVISNRPNVNGLQYALDMGIPAVAIDHRNYTQRRLFDLALQEQIDCYAPDLVVLAGFMRVLTPEFVAHYDGRLLNIHPSLLPAYPGMHTHFRALEAGDKEHGCSVHFVNEVTDGGPVVLQARVPILADDTTESLRLRVLEQEHIIYPWVVRWFCDDRLHCRHTELKFDGNLINRPFQIGPSVSHLPERL